MVQNNKVLTVSYGTFSCTLEGFDDSFDTMKAIAEYFRDLASDDRYFGAEPPQPDAEMLARIAQREISRQVEAHHDSKGITLRAAEADAAPLAAAPAPTPQAAEITPAATVVTAPEPEIVTEQPAPVETVEEPVPEITPPQEDDLQPQAEDAPVDVIEDASVEDAPEQEPTVEDTVEPVEAQDVVEAIEETAAEADPVAEDAIAPAADVTIESIAAQLATETDEAPEIEAEIPEAEVLEEPEIVPSSDSIAAKLQRIRAVVSRNEQSTDEADYSEDEHAEDLSLNRNQIVEEAQSDDDISAILENVEQASDTAETPTEGDALFSDLDTDADSEDSDNELMNILGEPEEPIAPVNKPRRVRVIKVKNTDFENAVSSGDVEQVEAEVEEEAPQAKEQRPTAASLSPEDEEDLLRELAAVEAELKAKANQEDDAEAEEEEAAQIEEEAQSTEEDASFVADAAEVIEPEQADASPKAARQPAPEKSDDDLSRLMEAADQKLDDPDLSTNRDTYSHLRAAVAAAEAERSAGGTVGTESSDDVYREDLAAVVRPRRPTVGSGRSRPRAEAEKPAPLKLVAEQRVDTSVEPTTNRGPVRPRRVPSLSVDEAETSDAGGFAQYAAENGATTLPEMLEAAAAYMSFVENRDQFSRPQLMNKVRQLQVESFNREDGLRTFGQLLRDGKIEKTGGGRFTASGQIGFQPDSRAAG